VPAFFGLSQLADCDEIDVDVFTHGSDWSPDDYTRVGTLTQTNACAEVGPLTQKVHVTMRSAVDRLHIHSPSPSSDSPSSLLAVATAV
jgi:hypothetical protein